MALAATAAVAGSTALAAYLDARLRLSEDVKEILHQRRVSKLFNQAAGQDRLSPWYLFAQQVPRFPDHRCIWTRSSCYTWKDTHDAAGRYAQFLLASGIRAGDVVALYLQNSPEFIIAWLGLWAVGCVPAMINYNLEGPALVHCLKISGATLVLVDPDPVCTSKIEQVRPEIVAGLSASIIILDESTKSRIAQLPALIPADSYRKGKKPKDASALFFTSGTTGLPKAAPFTINKFWHAGDYIRPAYECKAGPGGDIWYISVPLFHASGAMNAFGCLASGTGLAIAAKFSVSSFWKDVCDSDSTVILYVGETARYLVNAAPGPYDHKHSVRLMHGNGLRPDVWERFRQRFNVPEIAEFFSATEGNLFLDNHNKGPWSANAVGNDGLLKRWRRHSRAVPVAIDPDSGEIYRDPKTGFAKRQPYSAGGEILVPLADEYEWSGYWKDRTSTEKRLIRNVFRKGDLYYRSGDALRRTNDGLWFFMDRLGDTYRWKSENVSTAEVAEVLGRYPGVSEVVVYGVALPNHDGRAGCAALLVNPSGRESFDFDEFLRHARSRLPRYAVPIFIRLIDDIPLTGNNKHNKVPFKAEGVDLAKFGSKLSGGKAHRVLWLAPTQGRYVEFGPQDWEALVRGKARL